MMAANSYIANQSTACWATEQDASQLSDQLYARTEQRDSQRVITTAWHGPDMGSYGLRKSGSRLVDAVRSTFKESTKHLRLKNLCKQHDISICSITGRASHLLSSTDEQVANTARQRVRDCGLYRQDGPTFAVGLLLIRSFYRQLHNRTETAYR